MIHMKSVTSHEIRKEDVQAALCPTCLATFESLMDAPVPPTPPFTIEEEEWARYTLDDKLHPGCWQRLVNIPRGEQPR
jgi:hypothetical protein